MTNGLYPPRLLWVLMIKGLSQGAFEFHIDQAGSQQPGQCVHEKDQAWQDSG